MIQKSKHKEYEVKAPPLNEKFEIPTEAYKTARVEPHHQIVHFVHGYKRTIFNVLYIWENEMTHVVTDQGVEWIINKSNVLCIEKLRITK